jgi:hypothetical protein
MTGRKEMEIELEIELEMNGRQEQDISKTHLSP